MLTLEGAVNDTRFKPFHPRPEINAAVSIPMMAGGKFVGILNLNSTKHRSFTIGQIKALAITLSMAAPSIQNAGLFQMLREAETKYRNYIEQAPDGVFVVDDTGRYLEVNESACRLTGYSREEIEKMSIRDLLAEESLEDGLAHFNKLIETGAATSDLWHKHKDGSKCCLTVDAVKLSETRVLGFCKDITDRKLAEEELKQTLDKLRKNLVGTIHAMSLTVEIRDPYTSGHQTRVSNLARVIAREMGLPNDTVDNIYMAGTIHDIGKMSVPAEILSKPGKLTDIEFSLIKVHPRSGYDVIKDTELPHPIAEIVLQHHERLDGSGYPQGLKDGQILLESRIISVADVVEAMASHRPYRPAIGYRYSP